jgi:hypothetical protein
MLAIAAQKIASLPFAGVDNGQSIIYVFFTITPTNVNSPGNANPTCWAAIRLISPPWAT